MWLTRFVLNDVCVGSRPAQLPRRHAGPDPERHRAAHRPQRTLPCDLHRRGDHSQTWCVLRAQRGGALSRAMGLFRAMCSGRRPSRRARVHAHTHTHPQPHTHTNTIAACACWVVHAHACRRGGRDVGANVGDEQTRHRRVQDDVASLQRCVQGPPRARRDDTGRVLGAGTAYFLPPDHHSSFAKRVKSCTRATLHEWARVEFEQTGLHRSSFILHRPSFIFFCSCAWCSRSALVAWV